MQSAPSASHQDLHKNYDYNNLPSFGRDKSKRAKVLPRQPHIINETALLMRSPDHTEQSEALPFIPRDRILPDSLLESAIADAKSQRTIPSSSSATTSSFSHHRTLFSKRINGMFKSFSESFDESEADLKRRLLNEKKKGDGTEVNSADSLEPEIDFMNFLKFMWLTISGLSRKVYAWFLFILTMVSVKLLNVVERIPNPESSTNNENYMSLQDDALDAFQSTPVTERMKKESNIDDPKMPQKISRLVDAIRKDEPKNTSAEQYGTFFYKNKENKQNQPDLEAMFLKSNFSTQQSKCQPLKYQDQDSQLISRASSIKNDLSRLFKMSDRCDRSDNHLKPSFTRSTARFQDMEWLRDDDDDYLNNLESTKLFKEYQKIMEERIKMQQLLRLSKMKEDAKVKPLSSHQMSQVNQWWSDPYSTAKITTKFNISITTKDILTLADRKWLNDNVIDFYMNLINERAKRDSSLPSVHVFSTYFYTTLCEKGYQGVKKWAKRAGADVTKVDYVFVPVNIHQSHWALGLINNKEKVFQYFDSLFGTGNDVLYKLEDYMTEETRRVYGDSTSDIDYSKYEYNAATKCPTQENGFDCGVFTCTTADYISREVPLLYSQADMPMLRRRMAYEIGTGMLLDH
ncbi:hypothetical protein FOA43_001920 [Brettanomyces nanus]|uniref:Ubiquitin-like protease family profile domain-containing protein n=1 Tax=Eeniella nana TaxID=13502 RepID=A0A875S490_EENNA|nr:uncharacterized protein FOA43_001920 [Brettanomyces nanus]QPG74589.1 hypothetical protein FOA43_001920 [Brettanomyces nanus]